MLQIGTTERRIRSLIPEKDYMIPKNETIQRMIYSDSDETWLLAYHQLILFILVAGRAVMPNSKGRIHGPTRACAIPHIARACLSWVLDWSKEP